MKFNYIKNTKLPKLAWCSVIQKNSNMVNVYHGANIEGNKDFFVEGSWNGQYEEGKFDESSFFMGSGAKLNNKDDVLFSTATHTQERLYTITEKNKVFVGNSLPFILYMSNNKLKIDYFEYERDLNSILGGVYDYKKTIPLENNELTLYYYYNFSVSKNLEITTYEKPEIRPFESFNDYYTSLKTDLKLFIENANSDRRKVNYGLATTISTGYDAAASAVLAKELGCELALTFDAPEKYAIDSGEEIAKKMGYNNVISKNANTYLENEKYLEAEFVSSGEIGSGIVFAAFEREFENRIVFFGERGDNIWNKNSKEMNNYFKFSEEVFAGTSMIENRLKIGYIYLPLPLYHAQNWISIHDISNSKEMEQYSVGGNYDRPIPRKIVEEKGIDRLDFGQEKKGAGFSYKFDNLHRLKNRMSEKSYKSFYDFYKENHKLSLRRMNAQIKYLWSTKDIYIGYILGKIGLNYKYSPLPFDAPSNPGPPSYLFHWGNKIMIDSYAKSNILSRLESRDS